jgi:hypothetical protein
MGLVFFSMIGKHHTSGPEESHVRLNDIQGMSVYHNGTEYTLNFDQQTETALLLNQSRPIGRKLESLNSFPIEKISIYRFGKPNIELDIQGILGEELIFKAREWSPHPLQDNSQGALKTILLNTYDI